MARVPRHDRSSLGELRHGAEQPPSDFLRLAVAQEVSDLVELSDNRLAAQTTTELVVPVAENASGFLDLFHFLVADAARSPSAGLFCAARQPTLQRVEESATENH